MVIGSGRIVTSLLLRRNMLQNSARVCKMETTEKIAFLYLRFNGFFLMPHFTVFAVDRQRHVDALGIRPAGSREIIGEIQLRNDVEFIDALNGSDRDIILWAEVGTGTRSGLFPAEKEKYVRSIFGARNDLKRAHFNFDMKGEAIAKKENIIEVPGSRCRKIILDRFSQMESEEIENLIGEMTKRGSWRWSEDFLADLLCLKKIGFLKSED